LRQSVRLRHLFVRRDESGRPDLPLLSVYRDLGVVLREGREDNFNKPGEDLSAYRVVHRGDVVLNKMKTWQGSIAISDHFGIVSPAYFVGRPLTDADPRFLHHLLRSQPLIAEYGARSKGIRPSQWDLPWDEFGDIRVELPPLDEQRAIADHLDRETARIAALIAAKRQMASLLEERWQAVLEDRIQRLVRNFGPIPLKYVCREITVGIVVTPAAWYADSGVPAIRGTNLSPGSISLEDVVYLSDEGHRLHPKSQLRAGDVLVVRTGQAGTAAVVPPELEGANCIDLVIIRLQPSYEPRFLQYVLNSDWMQKHVLEHSVGTIQGHFNVGAASLVPVPQAPPDVQREVVAELSEYRSQIAETLALLGKESSLLKERRQALITAAVTGDLLARVAA
jgi:type I restriction enzyme, S subunit